MKKLTLIFWLLFLSTCFSFTPQNSISQKFILDYNAEEQIVFSSSSVRVVKFGDGSYSIKAKNAYSENLGYVRVELLLFTFQEGDYSFTKSAEHPILTGKYGINFHSQLDKSYVTKGSITITNSTENYSISGAFEGITVEGKRIEGSFENVAIN